jgi:hypothetical protein
MDAEAAIKKSLPSNQQLIVYRLDTRKLDGAWLPEPPGEPRRKFDLAYVDGGHELDCVQADIRLCVRCQIPYVLFDDWLPEYGPGVQQAIQESEYSPIALFGNMMLCRWFPKDTALRTNESSLSGCFKNDYPYP